MKKTICSFVVMLSITINAQKQNVEPYVIKHCIDKMTDKEYYIPKKDFVASNANKTKGVIISPNFEMENGSLVLNQLLCTVLNIGNCKEKDELIVLFTDDTKITLTSYNKFNCDGYAFYSLSSDDRQLLSSKKISAIRFIDSRSFESLNYKLQETEKDYFMRAINNHKIVEITCD
jgi:hypothetical protein